MTLNLAETSVVKSRPSVLHGANLFIHFVSGIYFIFLYECRSFGIALWEVFTCGDVPYGNLSNENVLHQVIKDGSVRLSQPDLPVANIDRL